MKTQIPNRQLESGFGRVPTFTFILLLVQLHLLLLPYQQVMHEIYRLDEFGDWVRIAAHDCVGYKQAWTAILLKVPEKEDKKGANVTFPAEILFKQRIFQ